MTAAMVLTAGLGTRLGPLTRELAKPLMPVGDRPVLAHILGLLAQGAVNRVVANTHYRPQDFSNIAGKIGQKIHLSHEAKILGTAGGVAHAAPALGDGSVVVWNGDILPPEFDVATLIEAHGRLPSDDPVWVVAPAAVGTGTVGLGEGGRVVRLRGERFGEETSGGDFLGIQIMGPEVRRALPSEGCLVADVALPRLRRGGQIASLVYRGAWDDVGHPVFLLRANLRWLDRQGLGVWQAPDARVDAGVTLERAVIGAGAHVTGSGVVRETVVFPGAGLVAPAMRTLAAPHDAVIVPEA